MSMTKLVFSSSFDASLDNSIKIIEDPKQLTKTASTIFGCDYADVMPDKDHVGIHVVALGDHEHYGANRNFDSWTKKACINYHDTFVKNGHVYRHHRNTNPAKSIGNIVKSAYNDQMGRVELMIHAHKVKAEDELHKLATTGEVPLSMACVLDASYPVLTRDRGYTAIADIVVGDYVLTHLGNWKRVKAINRRQYTGDAVTLKFYGLALPLTLTADHMMMLKLFGQPDTSKRAFKDSAAYDGCVAAWAHVNHAVVSDRIMARIPGRYNGYGEIDSLDLARIMGYYLAEGSLGFNGDRASSVVLSCNMSDSLPRIVPGIVERMLPGTTCKIRTHHNSDQALTVTICNTEFAEFLRGYVGRTSHRKFICPEIFNATPEIKLAYLGAWLDGDGFVDAKGIHWSTCNRNLALQGRDLLASIGIPSSIYAIDHAKCATSGHAGSGWEYTLNIGRMDCGELEPWSKKIAEDEFPDPSRSKLAAMRASSELEYAYRIKDVVTAAVVDVPVYNMEVEDDASYTLAGMLSHNCKVAFDRCSICGNHRKSSLDPNQCDHIKHEFGKLAEDGKRVFTFNDEPQFFDISFVTRPADRIAWSLKTASGDILDSIKLAEYEGVYVPDRLAITSEGAMKKLDIMKKLAAYEEFYLGMHKRASTPTSSERYLTELRKAACATLPDASIAVLRCHEPRDVFYKLARAGIVMDVASFYKYVFGPQYKLAEMHLPEIHAVLPDVYSRLVKDASCQALCNVEIFDVEADRYTTLFGTEDVKLAKEVSKIAADTTFIGPDVDRRIIDATLQKINLEKPLDKKAGIESNSNVIVNTLVEKYAAYKLSALKDIVELNRVIDTDALFAVAVAQDL